jgi:hypothetical protein
MQRLEIVLCFSEVIKNTPRPVLYPHLNGFIRIEWGLPTQFKATDQFLNQWADAQKLAYSKGAGWIVSCFLNWLNDRILISSSSGISRSKSLT